MKNQEIKLVRQYAINEISGGLILGDFALESENPYVRSNLTFHSMDELRHGWRWTKFLDEQGAGVAKAKRANEYFDFMSSQDDEIYFLASVHVYELRVPFHFNAHLEHPQINPDLKNLMTEIRDDEEYHLDWIRKYLIGVGQDEPQKVIEAVKKCEKREAETYRRYLDHMKQYDGYIRDLVDIVESKIESFNRPSESFIKDLKDV